MADRSATSTARIALPDEGERLRELEIYEVYGTASEREYDHIAQLAADLFGAPIALINLVGRDSIWTKAGVGLDSAREVPRDVTLCTHALTGDDMLVVPDLREDARFAANPLVTGAPGLRFYAGVPLVTPRGYKLGTLCVLDTEPRPALGEREASRLRALAQLVMDRLELGRTRAVLARRTAARIEEAERHAQALAASEGRAAALAAERGAILDQLAEGVIVADPEGCIRFVNAAAARLHGTAHIDLLPEAYSEAYQLYTEDGRLYPPQELPLARAALRGETVTEARWRIRRPEGTEVLAIGSARPLRAPEGSDGARLGAVLTLRDDTARAVAEAALRESEARFRATFEQSAVGIAHVGLDERWLRVNDRLCVMLGYTEAELLARTSRDVTHPDDLDADLAQVRQLLAGQIASYSVEKRYLRKDGETLWSNLTVSLARDLSSGAPQYFIAVARNIDDRKAAEAALRESEARLRDLLATLDLGTSMTHDLDGTVRFWSEGCARLYGWTAAEVVGRNAHELLCTIFPVPLTEVEAALARDGEWIGDLRHRTRDGREVVVSAHKVLRRDAEGQPAAVLESLTDVTEVHRAEARLHESEKALRQAQKLEAIGRLAAGVAHDFNNILQGVTGGLELALDEIEAGTPAHEFAVLALGSAKRGSDLTSHLLSYARKQMLQPRQLDVASFLTEMQKLLRRTLGPHIRVEVLVDRATPTVEVDPGQLETALLNLAINAAHAMPRGGLLTLAAHEDSEIDRQQRRVAIAVTDTGMGMDAATLAQACEPFFTTKGVDGTGLGLSMVQGFAEQSGGEMRIASAPDQGTTVQLRLPVAVAATGSDPELQATSVKLRGSGRVLLVDDVSEVLVTTGAFLERAGFVVSRAESGDRALSLLVASERFDVLVSDYAMPGLDGLDLIERARTLQPGLPALLITGFADAGGAATLPEGAAVLRKPFQRQQLVEAVLQIMGQGAAG